MLKVIIIYLKFLSLILLEDYQALVATQEAQALTLNFMAIETQFFQINHISRLFFPFTYYTSQDRLANTAPNYSRATWDIRPSSISLVHTDYPC